MKQDTKQTESCNMTFNFEGNKMPFIILKIFFLKRTLAEMFAFFNSNIPLS
jgi:hypothetical protein